MENLHIEAPAYIYLLYIKVSHGKKFYYFFFLRLFNEN